MKRSPKRNDDGFYVVGGHPLLSVTTALGIVDTGIGDWKARVGGKEAGKVSRAATTIGKQVHKIPEADVKGVEPKLPKKPSKELLNCKKAYEKWKEERGEKLLSAEHFVYSLDEGYAGTADAIGEQTIYDFKTSKKISPLYWLQLAAYAGAFMEMEAKNVNFSPITRLVIVRLDKESGDYYQEERPYSLDLLMTFYCTLRLWRYYNITEKETDNDGTDSDERILAGSELEPTRTWHCECCSKQEMERPEDSDDRSGEIWEV